jgi:DNA polymerase-3 subunit gamma/tau
MTLLRLLAFEPGGAPNAGDVKEAPRRFPVRRDAVAGAAATVDATAASRASAPGRDPATGAAPVNAASPAPAAVPASVPMPAPAADGSEPPARVPMPTDPAAWPAFVTVLRLAPMAAQLAAQTELKSIAGNVLTLALPAAHKHLADKAYADKLKAAIDQATGRKWMLAFEVGSAADASLAAQRSREQAEQKARTEAAFRGEPFVQDALARFDAKIRPDSIKPVS